MPTLLFGALPCTGGSALQAINWLRGPNTQKKIRNHWVIFRRLWRAYRTVAEACLKHYGNAIALAWPRACRYWHDKSVKTFMTKHAMHTYKLDGCMYGLRSVAPSTYGKLLKKPWTIASTSPCFSRLCRLCNHDRHADPHVPTAGRDTKLGENYTKEMVQEIHSAWREHNRVYDRSKDCTPSTTSKSEVQGGAMHILSTNELK